MASRNSLRIAVDLHIHSALSPCGDAEMTPGNIVGMAAVNELDAIAVTDHNRAYNVASALKLAEEAGIVVVPGMELETLEEIHVVCLFETLEPLQQLQQKVIASVPALANRPDIFGRQLIFNEKDEVTREYEPLLLAPSGISIDSIFPAVAELGGVAYPAHVDRDSYSVLTTLGGLPFGYEERFVEISCDCHPETLLLQYPLLANYKLLRSSDAHYLANIQEAQTFLEVEERSAKGILQALREGSIC